MSQSQHSETHIENQSKEAAQSPNGDQAASNQASHQQETLITQVGDDFDNEGPSDRKDGQDQGEKTSGNK